MRNRRLVNTLVTLSIGVVLVGAPACGGSEPEAPAPGSATPATTPQAAADAVSQMAQGLQQLAQNPSASAPAVDFEKLVAMMPELPGWTRETPTGEQVNMGVAISKAEARYTKDSASLTLEIADTALSQIVLAPLSMMLMANYSERSSSGYKKYAELGGHPGFESWEIEPKDGEVTVVVGKRFLVHAAGTGVPNIEAVRAAVQAVDLGKLAGLK